MCGPLPSPTDQLLAEVRRREPARVQRTPGELGGQPVEERTDHCGRRIGERVARPEVDVMDLDLVQAA